MSLGALVFGLISLIICATAAGTKNTLFIPLVVCLVLGCIVAAAALFVYFRQQRRQADLPDDSNFFDTYGYLILAWGQFIDVTCANRIAREIRADPILISFTVLTCSESTVVDGQHVEYQYSKDDTVKSKK